jgi:hypothetical protein
MRSDLLNKNSGQYVADDGFSELGGTKKILTYRGSLSEAILDSATTAYSDNDVIANVGALDVSVPVELNDPVKILIERVIVCTTTVTGTSMVGNIAVGTADDDALNAAVTGRVELFGAHATQLSPEGYSLATTATEADDLNFNSATMGWCSPGIILPVATKYIYVCTTTAINHATNFNNGRYNVQIEYTVL